MEQKSCVNLIGPCMVCTKKGCTVISCYDQVQPSQQLCDLKYNTVENVRQEGSIIFANLVENTTCGCLWCRHPRPPTKSAFLTMAQSSFGGRVHKQNGLIWNQIMHSYNTNKKSCCQYSMVERVHHRCWEMGNLKNEFKNYRGGT